MLSSLTKITIAQIKKSQNSQTVIAHEVAMQNIRKQRVCKLKKDHLCKILSCEICVIALHGLLYK